MLVLADILDLPCPNIFNRDFTADTKFDIRMVEFINENIEKWQEVGPWAGDILTPDHGQPSK